MGTVFSEKMNELETAIKEYISVFHTKPQIFMNKMTLVAFDEEYYQELEVRGNDEEVSIFAYGCLIVTDEHIPNNEYRLQGATYNN